jgi:hypothetical protein
MATAFVAGVAARLIGRAPALGGDPAALTRSLVPLFPVV